MGQTSSAKISETNDDSPRKKQKKRKSSKEVPRPLDAPAEPSPAKQPSEKSAASPTKVHSEPFVMISYSRSNEEFLNKICSLLQQNKIKMWHDLDIAGGTDFLKNIGQAVIDCSVFVYLISPESIKSKYCQDELALAYISNKTIIPVTEQQPQNLFQLMDTGTKLQLARMKWFIFDNQENFMKNSDQFIKAVRNGLSISSEITRQNSSGAGGEIMRTMSNPGDEEDPDINNEEFMSKFWERHFGQETKAPWPVFVQKFSSEYKEQLDMIFQESKNKIWLMSILQNEMNVQGNEVTKLHFDQFCSTSEGKKPFWVRVQEYAVEHYSIREVFKMESSVRVEAIENLGKYKSPSVIEALLDLLRDGDNNCKAVAAISLARTETDSEIVLQRLTDILDDKDRLVRESACLALGHLKATVAVPKLVHLWRNDFISTVRDAAELALEQIGGDEANQAIHMTRVLTNEIKQLMSV